MMARIPEKNVILVYEPEGIVHQEVDCPKGNRSVFASISKVRAEYPFVVSEDIGWGMEPPEPVPGGSHSTLVHFELSSGLSQVFNAGAARDVSVAAAWSVFSVADACVRNVVPRTEARASLILLPDFVALAVFDGGKRTFRAWPQPLSERDWKTLVFLASGTEQKNGARAPEGGQRGGKIVVITDGEPEEMCPIWKELGSSARIDRFLGLDALSAAASKLATRHPANLVSGFPRPFNMDRCLSAVSMSALLSAVLMGVSLRGSANDLKGSEREALNQASGLKARAANLEANSEEMAALRREAPDAPAFVAADKAPALRALAEAIPDSLTLTRLVMTKEDLFEMEAILVGGSFDPDGVRRSLAQCGFLAGGGGDWAYDPVARRLYVRGKFAESGK